MKLFISSNNSSKFWRILIIYFFSKTLSGSQTTTPDTLRFLIPGMCHLVAEDKPRKIILEMKMHETLFTYLSYHWTIFDSHKHWLKEQVSGFRHVQLFVFAFNRYQEMCKGHSFFKQCLHDLQFMKTRSSSPNLSKLARADISCEFMKTMSFWRHSLKNEWTL